ncbi:MAG: YdcF family protein [Leptospiraceae bacterium]|nr:YdcF family protein [Leptospiraceae bacterium]MDW7975071.1 YdcF family protein [Leptospiraceae bacterium]
MFFYLSKIFATFLFPLPLMFFLVLIFLVFKRSRFLLFLWILFGVFSTEAGASFLMKKLEDLYPHIELQKAESVDAVIVLGGLSNPLRKVSSWPEFTDGVDRIIVAERLWEMKKAQFVIVNGATGYLRQTIQPEAESLKEYLRFRIPPKHLILESESRNTYENALYTLKICKEKNIKKAYLVTSAFHMYRAYQTFKDVQKIHFPNLQIEIIPYPTDYRSLRELSGLESYFPSDTGLMKFTIFYKEMIGIISYKVKSYLEKRNSKSSN